MKTPVVIISWVRMAIVWVDAVREERPSEPQRGTIVVYEIASEESRLMIWGQDAKEGFADRRAWKEISFASKYLLGLASRHPEQAPLRLRDLGPQRVLERRASARGDDERAPARRRLPECAQICRHRSSGRPESEAEATPSTRKSARALWTDPASRYFARYASAGDRCRAR